MVQKWKPRPGEIIQGHTICRWHSPNFTAGPGRKLVSLFLKAEAVGHCSEERGWGAAVLGLWAAWPVVLTLPNGPGPLWGSEVCAVQGSPARCAFEAVLRLQAAVCSHTAGAASFLRPHDSLSGHCPCSLFCLLVSLIPPPLSPTTLLERCSLIPEWVCLSVLSQWTFLYTTGHDMSLRLVLFGMYLMPVSTTSW